MKNDNNVSKQIADYSMTDDDMLLVTGGVRRSDSGFCPCGRAKAEDNGYCKKCNALRDMK